MTIAEKLSAEFEQQAPVTRKFLERLPQDKLDWRPHPKSMTAGQLALHLAGLPGGVMQRVQHASMQVPDFGTFPQPASHDEVLRIYDESVATIRALLPPMSDAFLQETFRVMAGEQELLALPREFFVRNILFNHGYQHRGQLSVYLRLLDIPVPATWGPSADEAPVFPQRETVAA